MAEAIAAVGFAASVIQLATLGDQLISRINEFNAAVDQAPKVLREISSQLPFMIDICQKLDRSVQESDAIAAVIKGCLEHVAELYALTRKIMPTTEDGRIDRARKAAQSIRYEKKFLASQRILESYKTSLILYYGQNTIGSKCLAAHQMAHYIFPPPPVTPSVPRHKLLRTIDRRFAEYAESYIGPRIVILHGMGGQGKSRLALDFCYQASKTSEFQSILWMDATSRKTLTRSFEDIADRISAKGRTFADLESRIAFVKEFLTGTSWLIVLDNFDQPDRITDILDFLPPGNGSILFTSRHADAGKLGKVISILRMEECEGLELLLRNTKHKLTQPNVREEAKAILTKLGHLPLAIDQAGAYINDQNFPLHHFLQHYEKRKKKVLEQKHVFWDYKRNLDDEEKPKTLGVLTTWEMSFQNIDNRRNHRGSIEHLLTVASFLGNVDVGEYLFRKYAERPQSCPSWLQSFVVDGEWDQYSFRDAIAGLVKLSLVQTRSTESDECCISLHPMIKDWLQLRVGEADRRNHVIEAIMMIANFIDSSSEDSSQQIVREILEHQDACICNEATFLNPKHRLGFDPLRKPAITFSSFFLRHGRYREAEKPLEAVLENDQEQFGHYHLCTLITMRELASVYNYGGRYLDAQNLLACALQICEKQFGKAHVETSRMLSGLGSVYAKQNRLSEAEVHYERALEGHKRSNSVNDFEHFSLLQCLGEVKRFLGKHNEAGILYQKALTGYEKNRGNDAFETLETLRLVADLARVQCRYEEAEKLYERAWEGYKKQLGPDHPRTTKMLVNLAISCRNQEKYYEAERHLKDCVESFNKTLGRDHPDTLRALNNMTTCIDKQGHHKAAEVLYREVLKGREARLGPGHPYTLRTMERLAHMLWLQGKKEEAETLAARLLTNAAKLTNYDPQPTDQRKRYKALEALYLDAQNRYVKKLAWNHVDTLETYECLSNVLIEQGHYERAEELRRKIAQANAEAEAKKLAKAEQRGQETFLALLQTDPLDTVPKRQSLQLQLIMRHEENTDPNAFYALWKQLSTTRQRVLLISSTSWAAVLVLLCLMTWPTLSSWLLCILPNLPAMLRNG